MSDYGYKKQYSGNPAEFGRTAVLFGGTSAEREISLRSGKAILDALQSAGVDAFGVDVGETPVKQLQSLEFERAFIALHGPGGEDGKIQALLDFMSKPYTGSAHAASALAMDKLRTKQVWLTLGLPTPEYCTLHADSDWQQALASLGGEAFIKPAHEGSSIGMSCAATPQELKAAYEKAAQYDPGVLAERRIIGTEYTVAILNGVALPPVGLSTDHQFYDYSAKYEATTTRYQCPCDLSGEEIALMQQLAQRAFEAIGCEGWGRVDFIRESEGEMYMLEVNTVPGMTDHSLVPMAAKEVGLSYAQLTLEILTQTLD